MGMHWDLIDDWMEDCGERDEPLKGVSLVDGKEINGSVTSVVDDVAKKSVAKRHTRSAVEEVSWDAHNKLKERCK